MLVPVLIRINARVEFASSFVLETLAGINLPLLFPDLRVFNRSTANSVSVSVERTHTYLNQADPLFTGTFVETLQPVVTIGAGSRVAVTPDALGQSLLGTGTGLSTSLVLSNAGPELVALVSFELRGLIETPYSSSQTIVVTGS